MGNLKAVREETVKVLTRNAVKCLACNKVIESKHRHDFSSCGCSNETFTDGGLVYNRSGGVDLDLVENLCEYKEYTKAEYEELKRQREEQYERNMQERVTKGEVIKVAGRYHDVAVLKMLCDNDRIEDSSKDYFRELLRSGE